MSDYLCETMDLIEITEEDEAAMNTAWGSATVPMTEEEADLAFDAREAARLIEITEEDDCFAPF